MYLLFKLYLQLIFQKQKQKEQCRNQLMMQKYQKKYYEQRKSEICSIKSIYNFYISSKNQRTSTMQINSSYLPLLQVSQSIQSLTSLKIKKLDKKILNQNIKSNTHIQLQKNRTIQKNQQQSEKRSLDDIEQSKVQLKKKVNKNQEIQRCNIQDRNGDFSSLIKIFSQKRRNFFSTEDKIEASIQNISFPDLMIPDFKIKKNELLKRKIEIISNKNQKMSIPIHEGLYKSNTAHKNDKQLVSTSNKLDFQLKNQYTQSIEFMQDYKSGYAPIQMQKKNQELQDLYQNNENNVNNLSHKIDSQNKDKSRSHFIRKQQSSLRIPRTCGVSYIKKSQSLFIQKQPFKPLPPLIFQGSSNLRQQFQQTSLDESKVNMIKMFLQKMQKIWIPFIISDQPQMRDLLLNKKTQNAKVGWVQGIQNLWPLFVQGAFIMLIISEKFLCTEIQVWKAVLQKQNIFKIGILAKKSTSGAKAFIKSIKIDNDNQQKKNISQKQCNNQSRLTDDLKDSSSEQRKISNVFQMLQEQLKSQRAVVTMSLRFQMYVDEYEWKQIFTKEEKQLLNEIIIEMKISLEKKSLRIIQNRFKIKNHENNNLFIEKLQFLRMQNQNYLLNTQYNQQQRNKQYILKEKYSKNVSLSLQKFNHEQITEFFKNTQICSVADFINKNQEQSWKKCLKFPIYFISTRDSFAFDLIQKETILKRGQKQYKKIDYYFYPDNVPNNFNSQYRKLFPNFQVGVTSYHGFFTQEELQQYEKYVFEMQNKAFKNNFLQMTVQPSIVSVKVKRTKFFFGYRYMWTRNQLAEPASYVAAGVRKDVTPPPKWTKIIEQQMVKQKIVEKDFINSVAVNVYHDGKQGLAQHFDDAVRFKQPIYTLRLFSDARLSFGSQFYGFCNGAFIIPLPRGCICVMEQNSYAANCVKHCVRPCDMTGKSAAVILRQMHHQVVKQSSKYDEYVDFPAWLSCLSDKKNSTPFAQQKRMESQFLVAER